MTTPRAVAGVAVLGGSDVSDPDSFYRWWRHLGHNDVTKCVLYVESLRVQLQLARSFCFMVSNLSEQNTLCLDRLTVFITLLLSGWSCENCCYCWKCDQLGRITRFIAGILRFLFAIFLMDTRTYQKHRLWINLIIVYFQRHWLLFEYSFKSQILFCSGSRAFQREVLR